MQSAVGVKLCVAIKKFYKKLFVMPPVTDTHAVGPLPPLKNLIGLKLNLIGWILDGPLPSSLAGWIKLPSSLPAVRRGLIPRPSIPNPSRAHPLVSGAGHDAGEDHGGERIS
jgi:hypothetical protein